MGACKYARAHCVCVPVGVQEHMRAWVCTSRACMSASMCQCEHVQMWECPCGHMHTRVCRHVHADVMSCACRCVGACRCMCTHEHTLGRGSSDGREPREDLQSRCQRWVRPPHLRPGWRAPRPGWRFLLRQQQQRHRLGKLPPWGQGRTGQSWGRALGHTVFPSLRPPTLRASPRRQSLQKPNETKHPQFCCGPGNNWPTWTPSPT